MNFLRVAKDGFMLLYCKSKHENCPSVLLQDYSYLIGSSFQWSRTVPVLQTVEKSVKEIGSLHIQKEKEST